MYNSVSYICAFLLHEILKQIIMPMDKYYLEHIT